MTLQKESILSSKIIRSPYKKNIHSLFIFNESGICLYGKNFTDSCKMEEKQLISSFFSALMTFTEKVIGNKIKTIEMGGVKFVIIQKDLLYYVLLCDSIENLLLLENIVSKINSRFINYINKNKTKLNVEYSCNGMLNQEIEDIVNTILNTEFDLKKEREIIKYLKKFSLNDNIKGIILLTDKGKVIYSSLERMALKNYLKEFDFRVKIMNNSILKLFYTSKNKELIFSEYVGDLYFILLLFDLNTKFGVAEYYLQKIVKYIENILDY